MYVTITNIHISASTGYIWRGAATISSLAARKPVTHSPIFIASMHATPKRQKTDDMEKKIGTHNGTFHCDEALACYMLKKLPEYQSAEIIRTRDEKLLNTCDIVVDVGGVYDHDKYRYDHHQR